MNTIAKQLNKLANMWGCGCRNRASIEDALEDIVQNAPFGTKTEMVEILPEQSMTDEKVNNGWYGRQFLTELSLVKGKEYIVIVNGEKRKATLRDISEEWGYESGIAFDDLYIYVDIYIREDKGWGVDWSGTLGETITLAIYEEKEVVTPLAPKFVGGVLYVDPMNMDDLSLYKDETLTTKATINDVKGKTSFTIIAKDLNVEVFLPVLKAEITPHIAIFTVMVGYEDGVAEFSNYTIDESADET